MKEGQMRQIAGFIEEALASGQQESVLRRIHGEVRELALSFPLYRGSESSSIREPSVTEVHGE
jgi:glycine/serine hydroxymethyltransferase